MKTAKYNICITEGATIAQPFRLLTATGEPFSLVSASIASDIKVAYDSPTPAASFTTTITDPTNGEFILGMAPHQTALLSGSCYVYDVKLETAGETHYPLSGKVIISQRITE